MILYLWVRSILDQSPFHSINNNKSPYEMLFNCTPYYFFLKDFGCLCYPCLRATTSIKLTISSFSAFLLVMYLIIMLIGVSIGMHSAFTFLNMSSVMSKYFYLKISLYSILSPLAWNYLPISLLSALHHKMPTTTIPTLSNPSQHSSLSNSPKFNKHLPHPLLLEQSMRFFQLSLQLNIFQIPHWWNN